MHQKPVCVGGGRDSRFWGPDACCRLPSSWPLDEFPWPPTWRPKLGPLEIHSPCAACPQRRGNLLLTGSPPVPPQNRQTSRARGPLQTRSRSGMRLLHFQPFGFEANAEDLREAPAKLLQDPLLGQALGAVLPLGLFALSQQAGTSGFHHFPGDAGGDAPVGSSWLVPGPVSVPPTPASPRGCLECAWKSTRESGVVPSIRRH